MFLPKWRHHLHRSLHMSRPSVNTLGILPEGIMPDRLLTLADMRSSYSRFLILFILCKGRFKKTRKKFSPSYSYSHYRQQHPDAKQSSPTKGLHRHFLDARSNHTSRKASRFQLPYNIRKGWGSSSTNLYQQVQCNIVNPYRFCHLTIFTFFWNLQLYWQ